MSSKNKPERNQFEFENLDILRGFGEVRQLTGQDAAFIYAETSKGPMHIGGLAIYDPSTAPGGKVRFKDILNFVERRKHKAKTFTQKLRKVPFDVDHPYWVEDQDFDIEFHTRHIALPEPRDWRQLCILAARLHSRKVDMSRPLWELWVIEGLDNIPNIPKGSYAIVSKVHHCAIDGLSGAEMSMALHTLTPEIPHEEPPVDLRRARPLSAPETLMRAQFNAATRPLKAMRLVRNMLPNLFDYARGVTAGEITPFRTRVPRTRFNGRVSGQRVVGGQVYDLASIKSIRKQSKGTTVNDVMLTICGGALREYLKAKSDLPQDTLIAMAPMSVRKEEERTAGGNEVSAMSVALGSHIADPIERLHYVTATTQDEKAAAGTLGGREIAELSKLAPATISKAAMQTYFRLGLANMIQPVFNAVVSNVPGAPVPLYMNGARMVANFGLGPVMDGMGLFHAVTSYCDQMAVCFTADRKMMPDPDFYADCLWNAYEELYEALHDDKAPRLTRKSHTKKVKANDAVAPKKPASKSATKTEPKPKKAVKTTRTKKTAVKTTTKGPDDLKRINGIGPVLEKHLQAAGITTFDQIAALSEKDIDKIETAMDFKGRIARENWLDQAQKLSTESKATRH